VLLLLIVWFGFSFPMFQGKVRFPLGYDNPAVRATEGINIDIGYDPYHNLLPWRLHQAQRWQAGEVPLWDNHRFGGMPFAADIGTASWYPPTWLYAAGNFLFMFTLVAVVSFLAAMLLAYWFLRLLDLHPYASALGAIGFVFSAFMFKFSEHEGVFQAGMWLPLALGGMELMHRGRRTRGLVLTSVALALSVLAGHAQISLYVWLATAAWGGIALLTRLASPAGRRPRPGALAAEAALIAVPFVVAAAASAIQILPSQEIASHLARQPYTFAGVRWTALPASQLPATLIPDYQGSILDGNFVGNRSYLERALYPGIVLLPLAIVGILDRRRRVALLLTGMVVVGFLAAMGTPLYRLIMLLPGFGRALWIDRFIFYIDAGLAFLAALGLDALLRREDPRLRRVAAGSALVLALATAALGLMGNPALSGNRYLAGMPELTDAYLRGRSLRGAAFLLVAGALLAFAGPRRKALAIPIVLLAAADLWLFGFRLHLWHTPRPVEARSALVRHLGALPGPRPRYADVGLLHQPALGPNAALRYGLFSLEGFDIVIPRNMAELLAVAQPDQLHLVQGNWLGPFLPEAFASPVMDLLGVDVVVQPKGTARVPSTTAEGAFYDDTSAVMRRPGAFPPVFLASCWKVLPADRVLGELGTMTSHELRTTALVRGDGGAPPGSAPGLAAGPASDCSPVGSADLERYDPERVVATTSSSSSSVLVLTDTFMPGWKATVDGEPAPVLEVDHALRGVAVPSGQHRVEFTYRPSTLVAGAAVSGTTVLGLIVASLAGLRRRRRAPHPRHNESV
jgi:membrane protein YfhO